MTTFNGFGRFRVKPQMAWFHDHLLTHQTSHVSQSIIHVTANQRVVGLMQFGIGLFHEQHPQLFVVQTMCKDGFPGRGVVHGDFVVDDDVIPHKIFHETTDKNTVIAQLI